MQFPIIIKHERKTIRLQVEKIEETETTEKFRVIAKNQSFVLQNNRPIVRNIIFSILFLFLIIALIRLVNYLGLTL